MIYSMTSFARNDCEGAWGSVVWEVRSVNHRYLECACKLPDEFKRFEPDVRAAVQERLNRGKVDCYLRYAPPEGASGSLRLNEALVDELLDLAARVDTRLPNAAPVRTFDLMRWPGVVESAEVDAEDLKQPIVAALHDCLDRLVAARVAEGGKLAEMIRQRAARARTLVDDLEQEVPAIVRTLLDRFATKIRDLGLDVEEGRLEQECALLAQRLDVAEEIDRLKTHLHEVDDVLNGDGPVGRRLDFLMQELNREANTLGSKSAHLETTAAAVDLKVLIEQMREQVQNIE